MCVYFMVTLKRLYFASLRLCVFASLRLCDFIVYRTAVLLRKYIPVVFLPS